MNLKTIIIPWEALTKQTQKLLWQDQLSQDIDFIDPRVVQLRWLAIKNADLFSVSLAARER
jgi:hypothetical protein